LDQGRGGLTGRRRMRWMVHTRNPAYSPDPGSTGPPLQ
jgi:hypothetical protein